MSPGTVSRGTRDPVLPNLAEQLVAEGRGVELLPWGNVAPPVSAHTYLTNARSKYNPYGVDISDPPLAHFAWPDLAFYGTRENGGVAALEGFRRAVGAVVRPDTRMIEGANHVYSGGTGEAAAAIDDWLDLRFTEP